jgi:crossover junction endodeoxyribonuclease RusA
VNKTLTITLPLPHKSLSPNWRGHWGIKSKHTKVSRRRAKLRTLEALGGRSAPTFTGYRLAFFFPDARNRDDDNAAASCKAYRDGIADGLKVDDSTLALSARPALSIDRSNPRVEITLIH